MFSFFALFLAKLSFSEYLTNLKLKDRSELHQIIDYQLHVHCKDYESLDEKIQWINYATLI